MEVIIISKYVKSNYRYSNTKNYKNSGDVERLIKYVSNKNKRKDLDICGCINLIETEPDKMVLEMEKVKEIYDKQDSYQIKHLCIYIGESLLLRLSKRKFIRLFERVLGYFKGIQIVYAMHESTDHLHIHLALNTVSIYGNRLDLSKKKLNGFKDKFKSVFEKYYRVDDKVFIILFY